MHPHTHPFSEERWFRVNTVIVSGMRLTAGERRVKKKSVQSRNCSASWRNKKSKVRSRIKIKEED
jgi:hypothetical protein